MIPLRCSGKENPFIAEFAPHWMRGLDLVNSGKMRVRRFGGQILPRLAKAEGSHYRPAHDHQILAGTFTFFPLPPVRLHLFFGERDWAGHRFDDDFRGAVPQGKAEGNSEIGGLVAFFILCPSDSPFGGFFGRAGGSFF